MKDYIRTRCPAGSLFAFFESPQVLTIGCYTMYNKILLKTYGGML